MLDTAWRFSCEGKRRPWRCFPPGRGPDETERSLQGLPACLGGNRAALWTEGYARALPVRTSPLKSHFCRNVAYPHGGRLPVSCAFAAIAPYFFQMGRFDEGEVRLEEKPFVRPAHPAEGESCRRFRWHPVRSRVRVSKQPPQGCVLPERRG